MFSTALSTLFRGFHISSIIALINSQFLEVLYQFYNIIAFSLFREDIHKKALFSASSVSHCSL